MKSLRQIENEFFENEDTRVSTLDQDLDLGIQAASEELEILDYDTDITFKDLGIIVEQVAIEAFAANEKTDPYEQVTKIAILGA